MELPGSWEGALSGRQALHSITRDQNFLLQAGAEERRCDKLNIKPDVKS